MRAYRSGFVTIVGCPNVGKSTLLNRMIGQKVSIVSDRAQTTRNRITGVLTRDSYQIVFLDTPGVTTPKNRLGAYMRKVASEAMDAVEAILYVCDAQQGVRENDENLMRLLNGQKAPIVAFVNKCDAIKADRAQEIAATLRQTPLFRTVLCGSAQTGEGLEALERALCELLVDGPQYFPDDMVTDQPERVICAEMIREKALLHLSQEVPHGVGVSLDRMEKRADSELMDIYATIYCERASHKGIIIGKGGSMLKRIGADARNDVEWLLGCRVNLQLWVKIKEDWRNRESVLRELGYE